jgi:rubrerythrin
MKLQDGVAGETYEYKEMYPDFVKEAEAEGNKAGKNSRVWEQFARK